MAASEDNVQLILEILKADEDEIELFNLLGLRKGQEPKPADIQKHIKKLVVNIHPDKINHPQANEAFQKIFPFIEKIKKCKDNIASLKKLVGDSSGPSQARSSDTTGDDDIEELLKANTDDDDIEELLKAHTYPKTFRSTWTSGDDYYSYFSEGAIYTRSLKPAKEIAKEFSDTLNTADFFSAIAPNHAYSFAPRYGYDDSVIICITLPTAIAKAFNSAMMPVPGYCSWVQTKTQPNALLIIFSEHLVHSLSLFISSRKHVLSACRDLLMFKYEKHQLFTSENEMNSILKKLKNYIADVSSTPFWDNRIAGPSSPMDAPVAIERKAAVQKLLCKLAKLQSLKNSYDKTHEYLDITFTQNEIVILTSNEVSHLLEGYPKIKNRLMTNDWPQERKVPLRTLTNQ